MPRDFASLFFSKAELIEIEQLLIYVKDNNLEPLADYDAAVRALKIVQYGLNELSEGKNE